MATKTFTQAQLDASDLNLFANKGDTFLASSQLIFGAINNVFTGDYVNYKIVVSNFVATADCFLWIQLGLNGSYSGGNYYQGGSYQAYSTGAITLFNNNNTSPYFLICAGNNVGYPNSAVINMSRPYAATPTDYTAQATWNFSGGLYGLSHMGQHFVSGSYNGIRWATSAGSISSGNITVYGVMQA